MTISATIRTVNNAVNSAGQYSSLQAAIDASQPNDTLYIHASATIYPEVTVVRPLVIFGEGALPDQQSLSNTYIQRLNLYFSTDYTTNAGGSKVYGCRIGEVRIGTGNVSCNCSTSGLSASLGVSNVLFERNEIGNFKMTNDDIGDASFILGIHNNVVAINNIIFRLDSDVMRNCLFSNNIIRDSGVMGFAGVSQVGNIFVNNTFVGTILSFSNAQVLNNLFMTYTDYSPNVITIYGWESSYVNNVFSGPISFCSNCGLTESNNLFSVGNVVNQSLYSASTGTGQVWNAGYESLGPFPDFHIAPGNLGVNYGTDNTDVGIYGGVFPWIDYDSPNPRYRYYAPPSQLPVLQEFNVLDPVVSPSGQINIQFKAKSQN